MKDKKVNPYYERSTFKEIKTRFMQRYRWLIVGFVALLVMFLCSIIYSYFTYELPGYLFIHNPNYSHRYINDVFFMEYLLNNTFWVITIVAVGFLFFIMQRKSK